MTTTYQKKKVDVYEILTDKILGLLEKGVPPWQRMYNRYGLPTNYDSKKAYRGINRILLGVTEFEKPYFLTFKQAVKLGGKVKKGSKSEMVFYFDFMHVDENGKRVKDPAQAARKIPFLKYYRVFNIEQIEGIEFDLPNIELTQHERIEKAEKVVSEMPKRPQIKTVNPNQPYYSPMKDFVNMPALEQYKTAEAYYSTLFHELAHSTGHKKRLNRDLEGRFGSFKYGTEELIAEITACFVSASCGIEVEEKTLPNTAAYLQSWLNAIKKDKRYIMKVVGDAQRAADYILNK